MSIFRLLKKSICIFLNEKIVQNKIPEIFLHGAKDKNDVDAEIMHDNTNKFGLDNIFVYNSE